MSRRWRTIDKQQREAEGGRAAHVSLDEVAPVTELLRAGDRVPVPGRVDQHQPLLRTCVRLAGFSTFRAFLNASRALSSRASSAGRSVARSSSSFTPPIQAQCAGSMAPTGVLAMLSGLCAPRRRGPSAGRCACGTARAAGAARRSGASPGAAGCVSSSAGRRRSRRRGAACASAAASAASAAP